MAEEAEDKTEEKDEGAFTPDDFVYDKDTKKYVRKSMSPGLYRRQNLAATKQAATAGGIAVAGELGQFLVGLQTMKDPVIKGLGAEAAQLKADIDKDADLLTDEEKAARREAGMANVQRAMEQQQRRTEKIAASTGKFDAASLLAAGDRSLGQVRQAALDTEARLAAEDVAREKLKEESDARKQARLDSIKQTLLNVRKETVLEPLQRVLGTGTSAAQKILAYAPAASIEKEVEQLRDLNVPDEDIAEVDRLLATNPKKGRKMIKELTEKYKGGPPETEEAKKAEPKKGPVEVDVGFKKADEYWANNKSGDGDDFRQWARKNYPDEVLKDDRQANLDASGPVNSKAFKDAWNKYGEEYLKEEARPTGAPKFTAEQIEEAREGQESDAKATERNKDIAPLGFEAFDPSSDKRGEYISKSDQGDFLISWSPSTQSFRILDPDTRQRQAEITVDQMKESDQEFAQNLLKLAEAEGLVKS
jgi:hypothetical protein